MDSSLELEVLLKNMAYDDLISDAIRNNQWNRAINISKRRHLAVRKLIEKTQKQCTQNTQN